METENVRGRRGSLASDHRRLARCPPEPLASDAALNPPASSDLLPAFSASSRSIGLLRVKYDKTELVILFFRSRDAQPTDTERRLRAKAEVIAL